MTTEPTKRLWDNPWVYLPTVPVALATASALGKPHLAWDTSFFGRYLALPLVALALGSSLAAVARSQTSLARRLLGSVAVLLAYIATAVFTTYLCVAFWMRVH